MAIDYRVGTKVERSLRVEEAAATRVDPHPYIGIVKNNLDPIRAGRLQVWIPDLGGNESEPKNWRTVSYASPFMGTTDIKEEAARNVANKDNKFINVPHTYGMWMVPPDIGVEVIVIFIAGDPQRGYWIACTNSKLSRYMMPAVASSTDTDLEFASADVKKTYTQGTAAPVAEFNENVDLTAESNFYQKKKPIHEPQYRILKNQGLDRDTARGTITSSSQRESPSNVFGISTPGRPFGKDPADDPNFLTKVQNGELTEDDYRYATRQGGHTFIMDDGDLLSKNQLVRLRTAKGHQIMMNDSENTLYISHADGTSWIELTADGTINAFSTKGYNIRTQGSLNLHADQNININAGGAISVKAGTTLQADSNTLNLYQNNLSIDSKGSVELKAGSGMVIDSGSKISVKAGGMIAIKGSPVLLNSGGTTSAKGVKPLKVNNLPEVKRDASDALWTVRNGQLKTIVSAAPTHEPFPRATATAAAVNSAASPSAYQAGYDATKNTTGTGFKNPALPKEIKAQPQADYTVGPLSADQVTAYNAQVAARESRVGDPDGGLSNGKAGYQAIDSLGYAGKYQLGFMALKDLGYISSTASSNAQLSNPNIWAPNKDGIDSLEKFLASPDVQERAMKEYTQKNYSYLIANKGITSEMSAEEVGGMLSAAHLLGAGGANTWRRSGSGQDAKGTTGNEYYQAGRYAVSVLGPQVATLKAS